MRLAAGNNRQTKRKPIPELPQQRPQRREVTAHERRDAPVLVALIGADTKRHGEYGWAS